MLLEQWERTVAKVAATVTGLEEDHSILLGHVNGLLFAFT